jgi:hypothetical protein
VKNHAAQEKVRGEESIRDLSSWQVEWFVRVRDNFLVVSTMVGFLA